MKLIIDASTLEIFSKELQEQLVNANPALEVSVATVQEAMKNMLQHEAAKSLKDAPKKWLAELFSHAPSSEVRELVFDRHNPGVEMIHQWEPVFRQGPNAVREHIVNLAAARALDNKFGFMGGHPPSQTYKIGP